ncbi:MAG: preprotein translocase subunit YajC [Gemmatimonadaceae bacterium]|nr:preprotein translocase subunit YajC [Gemmatimonadaceae bacterium]
MTALFLPVPFLLQASGGMTQLLPFMFQIAAIFGIFYFLMIRPQQKQRKEHEARLRALKRGDTIVTTGGLVGEVMHIKESSKDGAAVKSMDDHLTIKSGESRVVVERGKVARVLTGEPSASPSA